MAGITSLSRSCSKFAKAGAAAKTFPLAPVVLLPPAVGHDDEHRFGLGIRDQVVEDLVRSREPLPFSLVPADAVQQVEHGIFFSVE